MAETENRTRKPFAFYLLSELILAALMAAAGVLIVFAPFSASFLLGSGYGVGAIFVAVLFAAVAAFYLLTRLTALWFAAPLCVAAGCSLYWQTWIPALLFVFGACLAFTLSLCIRKRKNRLFCAVCGALVTAVFFVLIALLCAYETIGIDGIYRINDYLADAKSEIHRFFTALSAEWDKMLEENAAAQTAGLKLNFNEQTVDQLIAFAVVSLPGYFAALCLFFSYFASVIVRVILKRMHVLYSMYPDGFYPAPSAASAVIFAVCLVLSAVLSDSFSVLNSTVSNLAAPLSFVFAMTGLAVVARRFARRRFPTGALIFLIVIALLWFGSAGANRTGLLSMAVTSFGLFLTGVLYPVLYFLGLFSIIWKAIGKRRENRS